MFYLVPYFFFLAAFFLAAFFLAGFLAFFLAGMVTSFPRLEFNGVIRVNRLDFHTFISKVDYDAER